MPSSASPTLLTPTVTQPCSRCVQKDGPKLVVTIVNENYPYTLAMLFAIWKLLGVMQKYLDQSLELQDLRFTFPALMTSLSTCTSSAWSVANVKCVPISHASLLGSSAARLAW
ncbi:hypothetical protein HYPSUDRAFT_202600 [Hypholoma sublateritium FD-334 SS-4]|uniref:Uncharacterized protein n=1 Tax=Hypholoma sublateritium (strain FD-334 SS-4) TaxID=945553 RepID=A0A0D2NSQ0_HYPSF|nr:hypothetical protein HYPSUDRAFT_202600 [Hypholoma sublateritium FD-334 SS-4]